MVGYTDNGCRLQCPEEQRIICSREVIFDETGFKHHQPFIETNIQEELESEHEDEKFATATEEIQEKSSSKTESINTEIKNRTVTNSKVVNEQPAPRRSTHEKKTSSYLENYCVLALHAESYVEDVPNCYAEIDSRNDREEWFETINKELKIQDNKTWNLTHLPSEKRAIDNKQIFKIKRDEHIQRYKARRLFTKKEF